MTAINNYITKIEDLGADKLAGGDMEFAYVLRIFYRQKDGQAKSRLSILQDQKRH